MSKNQTAVSWLFEQLWETPQYETEWQKLLEQAKQLEKEQHIEAYKEAYSNGVSGIPYYAEQYYSETYE